MKSRGWLVLLLAAFALRVWDLGARSLWFDEAVEYGSAAAPLASLPQTLGIAYQPPLYTVLLHVWLLAGMDAVWLRFLSVALSMLALVGVAAWANRVYGARGALAAGALMAVLPTEVRYAQEVGEYALVGCALAWALNRLDAAMRCTEWPAWIAWAACGVAAVYTHYGAALALAPVALAALLENARRGNRRGVVQQFAVSAGAVAAGLPLVGLFLYQARREIGQASAAPIVSLTGELSRLGAGLQSTFLFQLIGWPYTALPAWPGLAVLAAALILGAAVLVVPRAGVARRPIVWFLAALAAYFAAVRGGLYGYGVFGTRYSLVLTPLFMMVVAAGVEQLWRWRAGALAAVLAAALVGLSIYSLPNRSLSERTRGLRAWPETQDMREVVDFWQAQGRDGTPLYAYYGAVPALQYYLRLDCWKAGIGQACPMDDVYLGEYIRGRSPEEQLRSIQRTLVARPAQLWILFSHVYDGEEEAILQQLSAQYVIAAEYRQTNVALYRLALR